MDLNFLPISCIMIINIGIKYITIDNATFNQTGYLPFCMNSYSSVL